MDITIGEMTSTVRAVDDDALLAPETLHAIVAAVLDAIDERDRVRERVNEEQRVGDGLWHRRTGAREAT